MTPVLTWPTAAPISRELPNLAATRTLAGELASLLRARLEQTPIVTLTGTLGAGKTTLTRSLAEALGVAPDHVSSPTYVILHEYLGDGLRLLHLDAYRLRAAADLDAIGWDEVIAPKQQPPTLVVLEWPQRVEGLFGLVSPRTLHLAIDILGQTARRITLSTGEPPATVATE